MNTNPISSFHQNSTVTNASAASASSSQSIVVGRNTQSSSSAMSVAACAQKIFTTQDTAQGPNRYGSPANVLDVTPIKEMNIKEKILELAIVKQSREQYTNNPIFSKLLGFSENPTLKGADELMLLITESEVFLLQEHRYYEVVLFLIEDIYKIPPKQLRNKKLHSTQEFYKAFANDFLNCYNREQNVLPKGQIARKLHDTIIKEPQTNAMQKVQIFAAQFDLFLENQEIESFIPRCESLFKENLDQRHRKLLASIANKIALRLIENKEKKIAAATTAKPSGEQSVQRPAGTANAFIKKLIEFDPSSLDQFPIWILENFKELKTKSLSVHKGAEIFKKYLQDTSLEKSSQAKMIFDCSIEFFEKLDESTLKIISEILKKNTHEEQLQPLFKKLVQLLLNHQFLEQAWEIFLVLPNPDLSTIQSFMEKITNDKEKISTLWKRLQDMLRENTISGKEVTQMVSILKITEKRLGNEILDTMTLLILKQVKKTKNSAFWEFLQTKIPQVSKNVFIETISVAMTQKLSLEDPQAILKKLLEFPNDENARKYLADILQTGKYKESITALFDDFILYMKKLTKDEIKLFEQIRLILKNVSGKEAIVQQTNLEFFYQHPSKDQASELLNTFFKGEFKHILSDEKSWDLAFVKLVDFLALDEELIIPAAKNLLIKQHCPLIKLNPHLHIVLAQKYLSQLNAIARSSLTDEILDILLGFHTSCLLNPDQFGAEREFYSQAIYPELLKFLKETHLKTISKNQLMKLISIIAYTSMLKREPSDEVHKVVSDICQLFIAKPSKNQILPYLAAIYSWMLHFPNGEMSAEEEKLPLTLFSHIDSVFASLSHTSFTDSERICISLLIYEIAKVKNNRSENFLNKYGMTLAQWLVSGNRYEEALQLFRKIPQPGSSEAANIEWMIGLLDSLKPLPNVNDLLKIFKYQSRTDRKMIIKFLANPMIDPSTIPIEMVHEHWLPLFNDTAELKSPGINYFHRFLFILSQIAKKPYQRQTELEEIWKNMGEEFYLNLIKGGINLLATHPAIDLAIKGRLLHKIWAEHKVKLAIPQIASKTTIIGEEFAWDTEYWYELLLEKIMANRNDHDVSELLTYWKSLETEKLQPMSVISFFFANRLSQFNSEGKHEIYKYWKEKIIRNQIPALEEDRDLLLQVLRGAELRAVLENSHV